MLVHPPKAFRRQRGAGRANSPQLAQVIGRARLQARFHTGGNIACAGAEERHATLLGQLPKHVQGRVGWAAIVEEDRGSHQQPSNQEVPHHPSGRRVPEENISRFQIQAQPHTFEMFEDNTAVSLHDGLWQTSSP